MILSGKEQLYYRMTDCTRTRVRLNVSTVLFLSFFVLELREAFSLFDCDSDGTITKDELGTVMEKLGISSNQEEIDEMIKEVDEDGE